MESLTTGVRISRIQANKLEALAQSLQMTKNQVWGLLIDSAEIESRPVVNVSLKSNSRNAQILADQGAAAVSANSVHHR